MATMQLTAQLLKLKELQGKGILTAEEGARKRDEFVTAATYPPKLGLQEAEEAIAELNELKASGLLTEAEYNAKRQLCLTSVSFESKFATPVKCTSTETQYFNGTTTYVKLPSQYLQVGLRQDSSNPAHIWHRMAAGGGEFWFNPVRNLSSWDLPALPDAELRAAGAVKMEVTPAVEAKAKTEPEDKTDSERPPEDSKYFEYYGDFSHQELMLNDQVRTGTYQKAIMINNMDFQGKVVADVGTGTGILSIFAARAGAKKVYAIEASPMAYTARKIIAHNRLDHIIEVVHGKVEEVVLPEKVDILISEPLGFWLVNEQMIQSYVRARDKFLKPNGLMFPAFAKFYTAPCNRADIYQETQKQSQGWLEKSNFYGIDFTILEPTCREQFMTRLVIDQMLPCQVLAPATEFMIDFRTISDKELDDFVVPLRFNLPYNIHWNSYCMWYDTYFVPENPKGEEVCLPTAPNRNLTCWYQSIGLLPEELLSSSFEGQLHFIANSERTYDIHLAGNSVNGLDKSRKGVQRRYTFTQPVYKYYSRFNELIWDIAMMPAPQLQWGYVLREQEEAQRHMQAHGGRDRATLQHHHHPAQHYIPAQGIPVQMPHQGMHSPINLLFGNQG